MKKLLSTLLFLFVIAILSLSAQNRIYPPNLTSPENGDDDQMPDVIADMDKLLETELDGWKLPEKVGKTGYRNPMKPYKTKKRPYTSVF